MRLAYLTVASTFAVLGLLLAADRDRDTEILVFRRQIGVLERQLGGKKVRFSPVDRAWLAALGPPRPATASWCRSIKISAAREIH